jgi:hypothetical protein
MDLFQSEEQKLMAAYERQEARIAHVIPPTAEDQMSA